MVETRNGPRAFFFSVSGLARLVLARRGLASFLFFLRLVWLGLSGWAPSQARRRNIKILRHKEFRVQGLG